jgi:predicted PurR-regulated permease PerM
MGHLATIAHGLIIAALIVVLLIAGREILEPLVIAGLLAFILSPLIRRLRHWGVWRNRRSFPSPAMCH